MIPKEEKEMIVPVTATLREIEGMFRAAGEELWLVGGCVRDSLLGIVPKDMDLATSATPERQMAIYDANGVRHEPTGLQHGTITVIRNHEIYEITSFRTDAETDGRHARVVFTPDLRVDLQRRDLTINAMAMSFDGEIVDPFDGRADLADGRVRFVGDAGLRIREDYLRILRWFRFLGRFAPETGPVFDAAGYDAIRREASGLSRISVERVWSEMSRILTGPQAVPIVGMIQESGVAEAIRLPVGDASRLETARRYDMDPPTTLAGHLAMPSDQDATSRTAIAWKLSNDEKHRARFVAKRLLGEGYSTEAAKIDLVDGVDVRLVADVLRLAGKDAAAAEIMEWTVPVFPLAGRDLVAGGMAAGPRVGARLKRMRAEWIASDYALGSAELLDRVPA